MSGRDASRDDVRICLFVAVLESAGRSFAYLRFRRESFSSLALSARVGHKHFAQKIPVIMNGVSLCLISPRSHECMHESPRTLDNIVLYAVQKQKDLPGQQLPHFFMQIEVLLLCFQILVLSGTGTGRSPVLRRPDAVFTAASTRAENYFAFFRRG